MIAHRFLIKHYNELEQVINLKNTRYEAIHTNKNCLRKFLLIFLIISIRQ